MTDISTKTTKSFKFSYPTCTNEEVFFKLEVPVEIPYDGSTRELVQRVKNMFHLPVYLEDELNEKLTKFIVEETENYHNDRDEVLLNKLKNSDINVEGIVKNWEKLFKDNVVEFAEQKGTSDEEVFAAAYHKLVHSPALETILQVEDSYARTVADMLKNRDEDIKKLSDKQTQEMEEKVRLLNTFTTEEEINELAAKHFEEQSLVAGRWGSQIDALQQTQRTQHRAWLMNTLEEYQSTSALNTPSNSPLGTFSLERSLSAPAPAPRQTLEESFTIHLGSQLKQTYNIRIVAMDMKDLCSAQRDDTAWERSRRLQTQLGLYGSALCGGVALCGADMALCGTALHDAAAASTECHFTDLDRQLRDMLDAVRDPAEKRNNDRVKEQVDKNCSRFRSKTRFPLQTGDVFITKHSNLADLHLMFHLVVDDTLKSGDITSRHPAILGLRNILKAACSNDITSITLPLLLRDEISEEMTGAWCVRRGELVLKCVKGFMLEAAGGGGAQVQQLQLAVPRALQPDLFAALAELLPTVFRLSNPLKFKAAT